MDRRQFFTTCKYCGKQILMIRNVETGRYTPCNPEINWMIPTIEGNEVFIDEDGRKRIGAYTDTAREVGYKKHSITCTGRTA